jgi:TetR/AcrR family transcriptional regulator, mexJK operon transcriptional repressor
MHRKAAQTTPDKPLSFKAERILNAALRLFTERGYSATSMDVIAASANVSKTTVYAHFANKEQLFAAMVRRECERCVHQMAIPDDLHNLELRTALTRIARTFLDILMAPRILTILRIVIAEVRRFPELGRIYYDSGPRIALDGVAHYLERACNSGLIEAQDVRLAAAQFVGMLRGDLFLRRMVGIDETEDLKRIADAAVETFLKAYGSE